METRKYHMWIQNEKSIEGKTFLKEEEILNIIKKQIKKYNKVIINIEKQPGEKNENKKSNK